MSIKGQKQLEAVYEAQLILSKINNEYSLLQENILTSSLNIGEWFLKAIPYIKNVGLSSIGVNLISKVLEYLGKKANTVSEEDAKKMYSIAPPEIKQRFDELAQLKDKDPEAYQAGIKQIRDYAMQDLKAKLQAKGVKVEDSLLGKTLTKLGSFGNSFLGTIVITGAIFTIMHFLGIYSPPAYVDKTLGDRAAEAGESALGKVKEIANKVDVPEIPKIPGKSASLEDTGKAMNDVRMWRGY